MTTKIKVNKSMMKKSITKISLGNVCRYTESVLKQELDTLCIAGNGFNHIIPKKELSSGDACLLSAVLQGNHEIIKVITLFKQMENHLFVWIETYFKTDQIGQIKIAVSSLPELKYQLKSSIDTLRKKNICLK
jgi:hypothetical protein